MNESENRVQQYPDQGVRYILLAIEAELLSEQAASPYLREAYLRLSRFWLAHAAALQGGNGPEKFQAPTRANVYTEIEPLCPLDNMDEDISGAHAGLLIDVEMRDGAELPLAEDRNKHPGFFGARRN